MTSEEIINIISSNDLSTESEKLVNNKYNYFIVAITHILQCPTK